VPYFFAFEPGQPTIMGNLARIGLECPLGGIMKKIHSSRWLLGLAVFALTAASYAQWSNPADDVPAYHPAAPLKVAVLPPILAGSKLTGANFRYPWQMHVYQDAAKVASVLYQLPCNCRCDRALGHTSLRSCFEGLHGTECSTCAKEGFFAYQQTKLGKTPTQIREAIARHEYESIDLDKQ
jgi:hypothetical protein